MKSLLSMPLLFFLSITENTQESPKEYLQKALANIENIKSANYLCRSESWELGDTLPLFAYQRLFKEYPNLVKTIKQEEAPSGSSFWIKSKSYKKQSKAMGETGTIKKS